MVDARLGFRNVPIGSREVLVQLYKVSHAAVRASNAGYGERGESPIVPPAMHWSDRMNSLALGYRRLRLDSAAPSGVRPRGNNTRTFLWIIARSAISSFFDRRRRQPQPWSAAPDSAEHAPDAARQLFRDRLAREGTSNVVPLVIE
jgi:hypothetical protein